MECHPDQQEVSVVAKVLLVAYVPVIRVAAARKGRLAMHAVDVVVIATIHKSL